MTHDTPSRSLSERASAAGGDDTEDGAGLRWQVVEQGLDQLLQRSHVASPDELPGLVADAAAVFDGRDAVIYLADLQQRALVPFQPVAGHNHDEFPQPLGVDSTVAGRAFQQMQRLTQSVVADSGDGRVRA